MDRRGRELARWDGSVDLLALFGEEVKVNSKDVKFLERILGEKVSLKKNYLGYQVIAKDVPLEKSHALFARLYRYPWLVLVPGKGRLYEAGPALAHVVGYVDADGVGRAGAERAFDWLLAGVPGKRYMVVDALGRVVQEDFMPPQEPKPGQDIYLSVDSKLQEFVDSLFAPYQRGAAVVLDVKTGEVLVLYSKPGYDPNVMAKGSPQEKAAIINGEGSPLLNRAVAGLYPPGSTFKPFVALAALEKGVATEKTVFCCGGGLRFGSRFFKCTGVHGCLDMVRGIQHSCNTYFYNLGIKLGVRGLTEEVRRWGIFTKPIKLGLGGERAGIIPSEEFYLKRYGPRYPRSIVLSFAIGQGEISLTPLHMAVGAALIAAGRLPYPHLLKDSPPPDTLVLPVKPEHREVVKRGMLLVVEAGTAAASKIPGFKFAGKTGTAQNPHGRDHSLFIFFAPYDDPQIAGAVVVEQGGYGASAAAPIASAIIRRFFGL